MFGLQATRQHLLPEVGQRPADAERPGRRSTSSTPPRLEADGIQLTINGGLGDDIHHRQRGRRPDQRRRRQSTPALHGRRRRHVRLEPGRRQRRRSRARPAPTRLAVQRRQSSPRTSNISANGGRACSSPATSPTSTMDLDDVESTAALRRLGRSRQRRRSTTSPAPTSSPSGRMTDSAPVGGVSDGAAPTTRHRQLPPTATTSPSSPVHASAGAAVLGLHQAGHAQWSAYHAGH